MENTKNSSLAKLFPVMLCFFAMGFVDLVGIASNYVKADLNLTDSQANIFPSLVFFWFLIFSVPTGMLMNRIGRKKTVLLSLVITFASLLLPVFGDGYVLMLLSFSLLGIGNALMQTSLNPLLSNIVSGERLASSLTFGQFVKAIASFLAPYIAMWGATQAIPSLGMGWRVLFPVYMVIAVIAILWLSGTSIREEKEEGRPSTFGECLALLGKPFIFLCFLGIMCHVGIDVGTNTTAPKILMERWGADAIRDCDGTDYPEELRAVDAKVYSTYYTTRKDNTWAKAHPEEIQQMYIMTPFYTAVDGDLQIHLMTHLYPDMLKVNNRDDITRWWEVIDRTTGAVVSTSQWSYDETTGDVTIHKPEAFHSYTVSFLAYIMWDPVHMYNAVTNGWKDVEKQITFDVRQPKTHTYSMERLRRFIAEHPYVDVIRYTTFFHQFTLIFDELAREKYVDWYGYSASVSPYILEQFEKEVGYRFRPEFIIDQGYMNNTYRVPSKEFQDFQAFQRREVAKLAKEMVDITHACGKEAMMFLGDHWIGMEPFMEEFQTIGLDAVVGSVGNGATLRLISDIEGVRYTEGRFLPYFFPDTFHEGGDPTREAKVNWVTARRAILRKPIDRIGYGGYLKLATQFPDFIDYVESVCKEFRELYENIKGTTPYCVKRVAILNCWGKMRAWGNHMVHHAIYYKQNYSYAGIIEALSGAPFDVKFISFDDIRNHPDLLDSFDVVLNVGDAYTAYTGGDNWKDEAILTAVRRFVYRGGGFIGVGEPASCQWQGHFFQLADILGVEEETGYTLNVDKYNWQDHAHFITEDSGDAIDFGEGKKNIFALESATVLRQIDKGVQLAVNTFGQGRGVYISGLPYSFANSRLLYRAILWAASAEGKIHRWFSTNYNVEVHAYVKNGKYCVVNNTYEPQQTTVYRGDGSSFAVDLAANAILWYEI